MAETDERWRETVKAMLKAQLKRRRVTYEELAVKLQALGIRETARGITNKMSRGSFTAVFLVQCLVAIGCETLPLDVDL